MILIVVHHYAIHGALQETLVFSGNKYILDFLSFGGKLGVNCFVLISGYFMCNSKITLKKILSLISEIWFYSIVILILFLTILKPVEPIGFKLLLRSVLPISYSAYWFATTYIVLLILSPFINKWIQSMDKKMHQDLLIVSIAIYSFLPTFMKTTLIGYNHLIWIILLYLLASYIRRYIDKEQLKLKRHCSFLLIVASLIFISILLLDFIGSKFNISILLDNSTYFANQQSFLLMIMSIEIFLISLRGNKVNKLINKISKATFAVYLIHDNLIMRPYLWQTVFDCQSAYYSNHLLMHALCSICIVFFVCIGIELIRQKTIGKIVDKWIDRILLKLENKHFKFLNSLI